MADLGEAIKSSWVTSADSEPPFGHAELVSLKTFCEKQGIPLDQAVVELRKAGFKVDNPGKTIGHIADSKGTSGMGDYLVIKKLEPKPKKMQPGLVWTPEIKKIFIKFKEFTTNTLMSVYVPYPGRKAKPQPFKPV
jgi:hypothetical protein